MAAQIITLADAVVTLINGATFTFPFKVTSKRVYIPSLELSELVENDLHVMVAPLKRGLSNRDRNTVQVDPVITIGVQQKVDRKDFTTLDSLMGLVEDLCNLLQTTEPASFPNLQRVLITNDPIFDAPSLEQNAVFFSLITAAYQTQK